MINLYECKYKALSFGLILLILTSALFVPVSSAVYAEETAGATRRYIYADLDDFKRIKELGYGKDEYITNWYQDIKFRADKLLSTKPYDSYPTEFGERTLSWGVDIEARIMSLSLVYLVENDERYASRAKEELMDLCQKTYWGNVLLDNSASARAAAIGYNWLYDYLGGDRETVRNAIYQNSLSLAYDIYVNSAAYESSTNPLNPTKTGQIGAMFGTGNHSSHNNAHYAVVALALMEDYPNECRVVIDNAVKEIKEILTAVFRDGAYNEGVGYWNYFFPPIIRMISAMESVGMDNPFAAYKSLISKSAYFKLYTEGTEGEMVYGDMFATGYPVPEELYYAAIMTNDKNLQKIVRNMDNPDAILMPLWFDSNINLEDTYTNITRDSFYTEGTLATMRSSWNDDASFVGFKGGKANSPHMDASSGTFTFDSLGERWTSPLGLDSYSLSGYGSFTEKNTDGLWRWDYYTNRAEANNCLVINPDEGSGQNIEAVPVLENTQSTADYAAATLDLTEVYPETVSYKRTAKLFDGRKNLSVKDSLTLSEPSEIFWLMNTKAEIELINGGERAVLTLGGKTMRAEIKSSLPCKFTVLNSGPASRADGGLGYVPALAPGDIQLSGKDAASIDGVKRLAIHIENADKLDLEVILTPEAISTATIEPEYNSFVTDAAPGVIMKAQEFFGLQKSSSRNSILHYDFDINSYKNKTIISAKLNISVKPYDNMTMKMSCIPQLNSFSNTEDIIYSDYSTGINAASRRIDGRWLGTEDFTRLSIDVTDELIRALESGNRLSLSIFGGDSLFGQLIVASNRNSERSLRPKLEIKYGQ